jgi:hypothetical protein
MINIHLKWILLAILLICYGCLRQQPIAKGRTPTEEIPPVYSRKVKETFLRHRQALLQLPGVVHVLAEGWGIKVYTDNPAVVPREIERVSIETFPADRRPPPFIALPH